MPEHLLDLRLGLEHEVLRDCRRPGSTRALLPPLVLASHTIAAVSLTSALTSKRELVALERLGRDVHADRRVAGRRGVDRHAARRARPRAASGRLSPSASSRARTYLPHRWWNSAVLIVALELGARDHLAEEGVGVEQHLVVEEHVVDAHDALLAQLDVVGLEGAAVHREPEAEVGVVVEVRAGRHDPVDEAGLDQRDQRAHAEPGRRQRAGDRQPDRDVVREHALDQELRAPRAAARRCRRGTPASIRSAAVSWPVIGAGSMRGPAR